MLPGMSSDNAGRQCVYGGTWAAGHRASIVVTLTERTPPVSQVCPSCLQGSVSDKFIYRTTWKVSVPFSSSLTCESVSEGSLYYLCTVLFLRYDM